MSDPTAVVDVQNAVPVRQLVIERVLSASPDRVFHAFEDPEQLQAWWWPNGFTCSSADVDFRVGGTYRLGMEWPDFIPVEARFSSYMAGEYFIIERPNRLVMSGRAVSDEQGELFATLIELTFAPHEGGTLLTMKQSYFDPMPPEQAMAGAEQGWTEQLGKLERLLVG